MDTEGNAIHIKNGMPTKNTCAAAGGYWLTVAGKATVRTTIFVFGGGRTEGVVSFIGSSSLQAPPPVQYQKMQTPHESLAACASGAAQNVSIAADIHKIPGFKSGVLGFADNALFGNPFSGVTDLITSFKTGEAGGHSVFYNMALGLAAGPSQGFGSVLPKAAAGTPWATSPTDFVMGAVGIEWATGVGEANLVFSTFTFVGAGAACVAGWAQ